MSKVYLTADMHFGHKNIILYENRQFKTVEHMDEAIIKNWNQVVSNRDTVIVAGDVSFYGKDKTTEIIQQLHGKKILVKGNHDKRPNQWWVDTGFIEVSNHPIVYKDWFIISHEPPHYYNEATPYTWIYGHVHSCDMYHTITKRTACVCVERWEYFPVELNRIIDLMKLV